MNTVTTISDYASKDTITDHNTVLLMPTPTGLVLPTRFTVVNYTDTTTTEI